MQAATKSSSDGKPPQTVPGATIFVVDDDRDFRDTLRLSLESVGYRVSTHDSPEDFLRAYDGAGNDGAAIGLLLLDVRMPGSSGLALQEELPERGIDIPVIFLTGYGEIPTAVRALKRGAHDFLQKPFEEEVLFERIRASLDRAEEERASSRRRRAVAARYEGLSPREREVMRRMVEGQASKVIAIELDISLKTVELHRRSVMQKMEADSIPALVESALELERSSQS